jgi:hypothetical protein
MKFNYKTSRTITNNLKRYIIIYKYMENKLNELCNLILKLRDDVETLNNKIDKLEMKTSITNTNTTISTSNRINMKIRKSKKSEKEIQYILEKHSLFHDFVLIKELYLSSSDNKHPIRYISKHTYQYWEDNCWNGDNNGEHIKKICIDTLQSLYLRCNKYENYINDNELYIKNQEYISLIANNEKYKDRLIMKIKDCILD